MASKISPEEREGMLKVLDREINRYLDAKLRDGEIREELYRQIKENATKNIREWLNDEYISRNSPGLARGLLEAVKQKRWEDIIYAFSGNVSFGTAGIRGLACFNEDDIGKFRRFGIDAPIIRGPNTINNIVLLLKSAGLAKYAREKGMKSIVIGYDSRMWGREFAELITGLFLSSGIKVYLFDEACPYPELTYAIPAINADLGVLISASHNDKRYNGYKISSKTGAQIDTAQRDIIYDYISRTKTSDIKLKGLGDAGEGLVFMGGSEKLPGRDYLGRNLIDMHTRHINHIKNFIIDRGMFSSWIGKVNAAYCAFYGVGYKSVPRILRELGLGNLRVVSEMNRLDGTFPCFHIYQQPDPGDEIAQNAAIEAFKKEHSEEAFKGIDLFLATDPDADRVGFAVKVPEGQRDAYRQISRHPEGLEKNLVRMLPGYKKRRDYDWYLLTANEAFSILLWYRIHKMKEMNNGILPDAEKSFIVINHTTTDMLTRLAQKHNIGVVKAWVGFGFMSECVERIWNGEILDPVKNRNIMLSSTGMDGNRCINIGAIEESSGMSILGGRPLPGKYLGENGHTRDKDGILAAVMFAELMAYAKSRNKSIIELMDENLYLDPDIGLFVNHYESCPYWGQFEGPTGLSKKIGILKRLDELMKGFNSGREIVLGGMNVLSMERYATGKYDELHAWKGFPDEGIRFFFDREGLNHLTVRPSGTSHCLRFYMQLKTRVSKSNLMEKKVEMHDKAKEIVADIKRLCGAD